MVHELVYNPTSFRSKISHRPKVIQNTTRILLNDFEEKKISRSLEQKCPESYNTYKTF
jgi:hypothetical protein